MLPKKFGLMGQKLWCEALSSLVKALRGFPWSYGQVTQNDTKNHQLRRRQLHESNLDHQISIGGKSSDYLGKFYYGLGFLGRFFD